MRTAKTLSKMNKKEVIEQLPNWFKGTVYELGDEVVNPFSNESALLDAAELSMYEVIKGAEIAMIMNLPVFDIDECIDIIQQGKDWFLLKNPNAYMILLD